MGKKKAGKTRGARHRKLPPGNNSPYAVEGAQRQDRALAGLKTAHAGPLPPGVVPGQPPSPDQVDIAAFPGRARGRPRPVGTVERDVRLASGTTIGAGSPVYPVSEAEARGLSPAVRAALALSEAVHADSALRPKSGHLELPGLIKSAPGGRTGGQVLDLHGELIESLRHPHPGLRDFYRDFVSQGAQQMAEQPDTLLAAAWGYMFVGVRDGDELLALLARQLEAAMPGSVTKELVAAVTGTYRKHPHEVVTMTAADLPNLDGNDAAGFAWLDEPVIMTDVSGTVIMNRAVSWCRQVAELGRETWAGVRITSWAGVDDRDGYWDPGAADIMRQLGELALSHSVFVPFGQRFARPAADPAPDDITRWLFVLWQYLRDKVAVTSRAHVERHAAKRALRRSRKVEVRVFGLREKVYVGEPTGEHRAVDWSCRWTVDPFARHKPGFRDRGFGPHKAQPEGPDKVCAVCGHGTSDIGSFTKPKDRTDLPWKGEDKKAWRLAQ